MPEDHRSRKFPIIPEFWFAVLPAICYFARITNLDQAFSGEQRLRFRLAPNMSWEVVFWDIRKVVRICLLMNSPGIPKNDRSGPKNGNLHQHWRLLCRIRDMNQITSMITSFWIQRRVIQTRKSVWFLISFEIRMRKLNLPEKEII